MWPPEGPILRIGQKSRIFSSAPAAREVRLCASGPQNWSEMSEIMFSKPNYALNMHLVAWDGEFLSDLQKKRDSVIKNQKREIKHLKSWRHVDSVAIPCIFLGLRIGAFQFFFY